MLSYKASNVFIRKQRIAIAGAVTLFILFIYIMPPLWDSNCPFQSEIIDGTIQNANEALCESTKRTQILRQYHNTSQLDPARVVIDQLLEISLDSPNLCQTGKVRTNGAGDNANQEHLLIILVESARENFAERQLVRKTWGSVKKYKNWHVRTVFLMGQSSHCLFPRSMCPNTRFYLRQEETALWEEHVIYEDTIIGAFADTYKNLTYKTLLGFNFVLQNCPADFVVKIDDDVFLDIPGILNMRDIDISNSVKFGKPPPDLYCRYVPSGKPIRCKMCRFGKYYTSIEEWPEDSFPPYCIGGGYAISMEWLRKLFAVREKAGFYRIEDVFVTGRLREIAETVYETKARIFDMSDNITLTEEAYLYRRDCRTGDIQMYDRKFGLMVFLSRDSYDFKSSMRCLWDKSKEFI